MIGSFSSVKLAVSQRRAWMLLPAAKMAVCLALGAVSLSFSSMGYAQTNLRIAVADLAYEERVQEYFRVVSAAGQASLNASERVSESASHYSESARVRSSSSYRYDEVEGTYSYIERAELRKFTADLKGKLVQSGSVQVMQTKPFNQDKPELLHDVLARIKRGDFPRAEYVLFGSVSDIQFNEGLTSFTGANTYRLGLDLVVDFSLINTKTGAIEAAFSAHGTGQDVKIRSQASDRITLNRAKVIRDTSVSLAENAYQQLTQQFPAIQPRNTARPNPAFSSDGGAMKAQDDPTWVPVEAVKRY